MQGSSDNSFIPKRKSTNRQRSRTGRGLLVLNIVSYSVLFAALISAGGVALYKNFTTTQLEQEIILLDGAVNTFSVQDFARVQEFDQKLTQAAHRIQHTASVVAILDELDRVTAQPIRVIDLEVERTRDEELAVTVNFSTAVIDSALFQRRVLSANSQLFSDVTISQIDLQNIPITDDRSVSITENAVLFTAEFTVPVQAVLFDPAEARRTDIGSKTSVVTPDVTVTPSDSISTPKRQADSEAITTDVEANSTTTANATAL